MKIDFKKIDTNKRLAIFALLLGFLAVFAGSPSEKVYKKVNAKEVSLQAATGSDKIGVVM